MEVILANKKVNTDCDKFSQISSDLIKWWTKGDYYHLEIIFCGKWISSTPETGVRIRDYEPDSENYTYMIFTIPDSADVETVLKFLYQQEGKFYDWTGIYLSTFLKFNIHRIDRWFCREVCAVALNKLGISNFKKCNIVHPNMLYKELLTNKYLKRIE